MTYEHGRQADPVPVYVPAEQAQQANPVPVYMPAEQARQEASEPTRMADKPRGRWDIVWLWVGLTTAAAAIGAIINSFVPSGVYRALPVLAVTTVLAAMMGALQGSGQWVLLRRYLPTMQWWVWAGATSLGMAVGSLLYSAFLSQAAFVGVLGCLTGALIPLLVGPLSFIQSRLSKRPVLAYILTFAAGMISWGLDRVISPAVEETVTGDEGLYFVALTIGGGYAVAGFVGLAQWLVFRRYLPGLHWVKWVLIVLVGGAFAGLTRALLFMLLDARYASVTGGMLKALLINLIITVVGAAVGALAGGLMLRVLLPEQAEQPAVELTTAPTPQA